MANVSGWIEKISKHEAWEIAKPWVTLAAMNVGVKSLYDVPEYFREKLELKGLKIGSKEFGEGLAGATADLVEKNKASLDDNNKGGRQELYNKLSELEKTGKAGSEEYQQIEEKLNETRSTEVKEAIAKINKKLSLTKEGDVRHSDARKEMARILREQRKAKVVNREALKKEVNTTLDDYTTQKVDGVTAARETLRSVLTVTGTRHLMAAGHAVLDGAAFVKKSSQVARREGKTMNAAFLAAQMAETARNQWNELRSGMSVGTEDRIMSVGAAVSKLEGEAAKYGINTGVLRGVNKLAMPLVSNARTAFKKIKSRSAQSDTPKAAVKPAAKYSPAPKTKTGLAFTSEPKETPAETAPKTEKTLPSPQHKITSADRSHLLKPAGGRSSGLKPSRPTIDASFADSYSQRASIKPSVGGVSRTSNVKIDLKNPHARRDAKGRVVDGKRKTADSTSQVMVQPNKKTDREPVGPEEQQAQQEQVAAKEAVVTGVRKTADVIPMRGRSATVPSSTPKAKRIKIKKKKKKAKPKHYAKALATTMSIWTWAGFSYIFQLVMWICWLFFFGLTYMYFEALETISGEGGGIFDWIISGIVWAVSTIAELADSLLEFVGISFDFDIVTPDEVLLAFHLIIMVYGIGALMVAGFQYMAGGLKPLYGNGGGLKAGALLLCIIGYSLPFLNLFPWIFVWTFAVLAKPK